MKKNSIVGYTGFVGSNLAKHMRFDACYNSKNIEDAYGTKPDLLVYAGVRAEKYLANKDSDADFQQVKIAYNNIQRINPKNVVLISTIDVYKNPNQVDEDSIIDTVGLHPYGLNRYYLENWIAESFDACIIRLPGLYGNNIKKNFIYDYIYRIPFMLTESKFEELKLKDDYLTSYYTSMNNGFYKCNTLSIQEKNELKEYFKKVGFSAINFTDSRGIYQFYNLKYLAGHIKQALDLGIKKLNIATEPIKISELYEFISGDTFINEISTQIPKYDFKSKYAKEFQGNNGYILGKEFLLEDIKRFVEQENK